MLLSYIIHRHNFGLRCPLRTAWKREASKRGRSSWTGLHIRVRRLASCKSIGNRFSPFLVLTCRCSWYSLQLHARVVVRCRTDRRCKLCDTPTLQYTLILGWSLECAQRLGDPPQILMEPLGWGYMLWSAPWLEIVVRGGRQKLEWTKVFIMLSFSYRELNYFETDTL